MNQRTRTYVLSRRLLFMIVLNAIVGGFMIGYAVSFLMWWNR